jgi:LysR family hca operon transcriptional activator
LELRHFRYFIAVAEEVSFTRAAQRLNTSQPSLSRQIRDIELAVGGQLLVRDKHSVRLSPAGEIFLREARLAVDQFGHCLRATKQAFETDRLTTIVGMSPVAELSLFPHFLPVFRNRFPDIHLSMRNLMPLEQIQTLSSGEINAGFMCIPDGAIDDLPEAAKNVTPLYREPYCLAIPDGHPLAEQDTIRLKDVAAEPFVAVSPHKTSFVHDNIVSSLEHAGISLRFARHADNMMATLSMVSLGLGLALMPLCARSLRRDGVVYRSMSPELRISAGRFERRAPA